MWSRGPNFSAGYFENPEAASRQWDEDGWFHSGDILYQDGKVKNKDLRERFHLEAMK
ncbi:AMP-binding protein [Aneurinibacillus sp. Ricciae_BoGa-3]|uniref:AMP-binding protein n=1 Tax=Aneurinibacillus sp. Ricciae_BoGa-3 TaxID=3022697 RepID=UPI002341A8BB|nr:AMP-binding protein [Aneurinibacillus sp. Ricciae_BoGa-3]WCK52608.1 AMP-binding protein [Aneurinibacillus sp. Ricciae_BoGa-3]